MFRLFTDAENVRELLVHRCRSQNFESRKRRGYEVLFAELLKLGAPSTFVTRVRPNSRVTSRHFDHSSASRAFMSTSNRPYDKWPPRSPGVSSAMGTPICQPFPGPGWRTTTLKLPS